jgi:hypothetical protein
MVSDFLIVRAVFGNFGGDVVKAGWVFIALGVGSAAFGQHAEAYVMAVAFIVIGLLVLNVKEKV